MRRDTTSTTATVFGIDVRSEASLSLLDGSLALPTGRTIDLSIEHEGPSAFDWPDSAEVICHERGAAGEPVFSIERDPVAGYLIAGPRYGAHLLSPDGTRLRCAPSGVPDHAWQRLLIGQVLPFASVLNGLEVLHASAVSRSGEALALLGPSGAGKTSLALELSQRGWDFVADDVLALEHQGDRLLAHPGTPVAAVSRPERIRSAATIVPGRTSPGTPRERMLQMAGVERPSPLAALLIIDRRHDGPSLPSFDPHAHPRTLLAATFNFVLATPERLLRLLDVCALAARLRVERVAVGPSTDSAELAEAVEQHLRASR